MNKNKQHWNKVGIKYSNSWVGESKEHLSLKELNFINRFFSPKKVRKILDIGIGNGRILANYLQIINKSEIFGIDISEKMVDVCKKRFYREPSVVRLVVSDFSREKLPFNITFDFISVIRVLKYNKNWPEMIGKISQILNNKGIAVFCMPNKFSLNFFSFQQIPFYRSSRKELEKICKEYNLKILDIQSFTRLPDIFYTLFNNGIGAKLIIGVETYLNKILGDTFFGRMLFLAVKKTD